MEELLESERRRGRQAEWQLALSGFCANAAHSTVSSTAMAGRSNAERRPEGFQGWSGQVLEAWSNIGFGQPGVSGHASGGVPFDADPALVAVECDSWADLGVGAPDEPDQDKPASFVELVLAGSVGRSERVEGCGVQAFGHPIRVEHLFDCWRGGSTWST